MRSAWIGVSLLVVVVGCKGQPGPGTADGGGGVTAADLGKLGFAIAACEDGLKKAPASAADLKPFLEATAPEREAYQKVVDGRVIVLWNAPVKGMKAGAAATVLAYAADVPKAGGLVLFGSGEVRTLTAAQFAQAPKAGQ